MDELSKYCGDLAYTPEVQQRVMEILQRKWESDIGNDVFVMPNYAPYDDKELANFYGIDTSQTNNLESRRENYEEQRARLVKETVREYEPELQGLALNMEQYRVEDSFRHGVADEKIYTHVDPDITLFRNYDRGWSTIDRPVATSDKNNTLNLYESSGEYIHSIPHSGWEVDVRGSMWSNLN
jgi:hypothetical protein